MDNFYFNDLENSCYKLGFDIADSEINDKDFNEFLSSYQKILHENLENVNLEKAFKTGYDDCYKINTFKLLKDVKNSNDKIVSNFDNSNVNLSDFLKCYKTNFDLSSSSLSDINKSCSSLNDYFSGYHVTTSGDFENQFSSIGSSLQDINSKLDTNNSSSIYNSNAFYILLFIIISFIFFGIIYKFLRNFI